ncbi:MAG: methyltransferase domain-containing protein [Planctomycetota bacterium]
MIPPLPTSPLPRRRTRPLTCLGDAREVDGGGYSKFAQRLPTDYPGRRLVRKWWEWDYLAECAETLGLLPDGGTADTRAVGLGVGHEPLIFYFAQRGCSVLATDLYAGDTAWSEARFARTEQVLASSPLDYPRDRVEVAHADMRALPCGDGEADFVWSCSSIEHVPTLADLFKVLHEIDRVLKPGGYALLTTEFCLGPGPYLLPGVNAWDAEILGLIRRSFAGFDFVGPDDLSFDALHPANAPRVRRHLPAGMQQPHATGFAEAFRGGHMGVLLGVSHCVPIAFVLQKTDGHNHTWAEADVPPHLRAFTDGIDRFEARREAEALPLLQRVYDEARCDPRWRQLALHAGRYVIDCHARLGAQRRPAELRRLIEDYLTLCPPGELQDADCLDLCAYLLGEIGELSTSADVARKALCSPSTSLEHVFALAGRFLKVQKRADQLSEALDEVADLLADAAWGGMDGPSFTRNLEREIDPVLSRSQRKAMRKAVRARVNETTRALAERVP